MSDGSILPDGPAAHIQSLIRKLALNNVKVSVEGAVPKGQNYTGMIYRVTVTGEKNGRDLSGSYIVKVASNDESIRPHLPLSIAYQREGMYYTELFPIYQRMQDEAGVPYADQFKHAECYHVGNVYLKEFLIFEDLKTRGYVTLDWKDEVDYEHLRCALEAYGKLHALSFALKRRQPEKFEYFSQNSSEIAVTTDSIITNMFKNAWKKATPVVENVKHREIIECLKDNITDRLIDILTQDEFSVLSHSDCWTANMMFNYKDGKPVETCLIDFQVCRYGAPTIDVMYYIFANTGSKLHEEFYEDLLSVYYNAMKNHLRALSYDIDQIYPWARFQQDLKTSSVYGLSMGLNCAMMQLSTEIPDISDMIDIGNSTFGKGEVSDIYKERVNDIVEEFFKYEYLPGPHIGSTLS